MSGKIVWHYLTSPVPRQATRIRRLHQAVLDAYENSSSAEEKQAIAHVFKSITDNLVTQEWWNT